MADEGLNLEGVPEWDAELLKGWKPIDLDRLAAGYEAKAALALAAAHLWAGVVWVYLAASVVFGSGLTLFVIGIPMTVLFVRYCYAARHAIELARHTRIRCDNDGLC